MADGWNLRGRDGACSYTAFMRNTTGKGGEMAGLGRAFARAPVSVKVAAVLIAAVMLVAAKKGWLPRGETGAGGGSTTSTTAGGGSSGGSSGASVGARGGLRKGGEGSLRALHDAKKSDVWVEVSGRVVKVLADDTDTWDKSDKHQKFLIEAEGVTVLVAHNISVSQRVPLREGDEVVLRGEYEYTEKGGTIHFTHTPKFNSRNVLGGWIEFGGKRYE